MSDLDALFKKKKTGAKKKKAVISLDAIADKLDKTVLLHQQEEEEARRMADEKDFIDRHAADAEDDDWINPVGDDVVTTAIKPMEYDEADDHNVRQMNNDEENGKTAIRATRGWGVTATVASTEEQDDDEKKENSEPAAAPKQPDAPAIKARYVAPHMTSNEYQKATGRSGRPQQIKIDDLDLFPELDKAKQIEEEKKQQEREDAVKRQEIAEKHRKDAEKEAERTKKWEEEQRAKEKWKAEELEKIRSEKVAREPQSAWKPIAPMNQPSAMPMPQREPPAPTSVSDQDQEWRKRAQPQAPPPPQIHRATHHEPPAHESDMVDNWRTASKPTNVPVTLPTPVVQPSTATPSSTNPVKKAYVPPNKKNVAEPTSVPTGNRFDVSKEA